MKKNDFQMAIYAIRELADRMSYSEDKDEIKASEDYEKLANRLNAEYWKKYNK